MKNPLLIFGILAVALVAVVSFDGLGYSYPVYDESGDEIESLFVGVSPDLGAMDALINDGAIARSSVYYPDKSAIMRHLSSWISPPSVSATGCGGSCTGHYQRSQLRQCSIGCDSNDSERFFYSDPQRVPWHWGRYQIGSLACGDCGPCQEQGCTNP